VRSIPDEVSIEKMPVQAWTFSGGLRLYCSAGAWHKRRRHRAAHSREMMAKDRIVFERRRIKPRIRRAAVQLNVGKAVILYNQPSLKDLVLLAMHTKSTGGPAHVGPKYTSTACRT